MGAVEPLKKLHTQWGNQVAFVDIVTRQAHPGPDVPAYRTLEQKQWDATRYEREERIPWPVLVDDLEGKVHQVYGGLADPTYLVDRDGRIAYYNMWTDAPTLHEAIAELLDQGGRGTVKGGVTRWVHLGASMTNGWRGLERGLPQSFTDMMVAAPGSPVLTWLGYQLRPVLAPFTLRAKPLPMSARLAMTAAAGLLATLAIRWLTGQDSGTSIGSRSVNPRIPARAKDDAGRAS